MRSGSRSRNRQSTIPSRDPHHRSARGGRQTSISSRRTLADQVSKAWASRSSSRTGPGRRASWARSSSTKSASDGYTVLAVANTFATVPLIVASPGYDPLKDFTGITLTCLVSQVLVVNPALPAQSVKELIALAKSQPGKISYASSGNGSTGHMAAELFNRQTGVTMLHVPYKGNSQALIDVISGQVAMMFDQVSTSTPQIKAGKVRAIAVTKPRALAASSRGPDRGRGQACQATRTSPSTASSPRRERRAAFSCASTARSPRPCALQICTTVSSIAASS